MPARRRPFVRPLLERLEDRAVPAVTASVVSNVLKIVGTASSEAVSFRLKAGDPTHSQVLSGTTIIGTFATKTYTKVTADLLGGTDSFKIDGTNGSPVPKIALIVDGGAGKDTLVGPNATLLWRITGANTGTVSDGAVFSNVESIAGGSAADTIKFGVGGTMSGNVSGGGGTDVIDYSGISAPTTTVKAPGFSNIPNITTNGSAALASTTDGTVARLTKSVNQNQAGSVFASRRVAASNFNTAFTFRMSAIGGGKDSTGAQGGDGMTFTLARRGPGSVGYSGGYLGYGPIGQSVAVEFDTWKNPWDASSNHLGIDVNGNMTSIARSNVATNFNDGKLWHAWIDYDGTTLKVYVAESATKPATAALSKAIDIPAYLESDVGYAGFTAAGSSGAYENSDIVSWTYSGPLVVDLGDGSISNVETVYGSTGRDFLAGPAQNNTWHFLTGSSGDVNGTITYSRFDGLVGNEWNDYFLFEGGTVPRSISGGGGYNGLNYFALTKGVSVNLTTGKADLVGQHVLAVPNITGSQGNDTLVGNAKNNAFNGSGGNDSLDGGAGDDSYNFTADTALGTDTIRDASGNDVLDFSKTGTSGITINLASTSTQTVNANLKLVLASATSIERVFGSSKNDTITGNTLNNEIYGNNGDDTIYGSTGDDLLFGQSGNDTLFGGTGNDILMGGDGIDSLIGDNGNDLLIGGKGADHLNGAVGQDLLIGGFTAFDGNNNQLGDLRAEWARPDLNYANRIAHLTGTAGGLNSNVYLLKDNPSTNKNEATVFDDSAAADVLTGGSTDLDWFIYSSGDTTPDRTSAETKTLI